MTPPTRTATTRRAHRRRQQARFAAGRGNQCGNSPTFSQPASEAGERISSSVLISPLLDTVQHSDALTLLKRLPDGCVDAVITDPPYAEIDRAYGRLSEAEWMMLMQGCVKEFRRVLKPTGSAVMVLQPNFEHIGQMRLWMWKFLVWCGEYWNIVQDAYWWNYTVIPTACTARGLMRQSVKTLIWIGAPDCYRDQSAVLGATSDAMLGSSAEDKALQYRPSGVSLRVARMRETAIERGGTTPFNLLPISNANSTSSAGANGHGAGTPYDLCEWWVKYISAEGQIVLDPFVGSGTVALAARNLGRHFIGGDSDAGYVAIANKRLRDTDPYQPTVIAEGVVQHSLFAA